MRSKLILYLAFYLFTSTYIIGQEYIQKYNELMNRYEFFDNSGNLIGYNKYNNISNQWEYYNIKNNTNIRKYEYVKTFDTNFMLKILELKQKQYELKKNLYLKRNRVIYNINKEENNKLFLEKINDKIALVKYFYNLLDEKLSMFGNSFLSFIDLKKNMQYFNPNNLISDKTIKVSYIQAKKINDNLDLYWDKILDGLDLINYEVLLFQNHPNTFINDTLATIKKIDYRWNPISENYDIIDKKSSLCLIILDKNMIEFITPDDDNKLFLFYETFENKHYLFYDSYQNLITIDDEKKILKKYYNMTIDKKRYLNYSKYFIISKEVQALFKKKKAGNKQ